MASRRGYEEPELVSNRVAVLLYGGLEEDRRTWAEEAASFYPAEGPLREVRTFPDLRHALERGHGVVYLPDVLKLPVEAQLHLVQVLVRQEERPKVVVGLVGSPEAARERGALMDDLHYRLHLAMVDLSSEAVRTVVLRRRAERSAAKPPVKADVKPPAAAASKASAKPTVKPVAKPDVKLVAKAAEKPLAKPASKPASKPQQKAPARQPAGGAARRPPSSRAARR
ncbi:MAG: Fis family transcriptional regulator [Myxococcaceae bacterium]|nr:Fis family transcriptional regulator [Myxococcaceae bacterium]MCI0671530.1 Fis family transcriptional regulator [Myxococcaceae bacterium]